MFYKMSFIGYNTIMLNIIVAPLTECEKGEAYCKRIVAHLKAEKVEYSVYFSPELKEVENNAAELTREGETDFIVVGNDVVLHSFLNSVKDVSKIKLGIVPVGEADFASYLGLSSNPVQAIKDILTGNVDEVDYINLNNIIVVNNIVVGASAEIYELYYQQKIKNAFTKRHLINRYGNSFIGTSLVLNIKNAEGKTEAKEEKVFELCVANGGNSKGNNISPLCNVRDGLFNLTYVTMDNLEEKGQPLTQFETGEYIYNEKTNQQWLNQIKLTPVSGQIKAMVDGQIFKFDNLNISVVHKGLKLLKAKG